MSAQLHFTSRYSPPKKMMAPSSRPIMKETYSLMELNSQIIPQTSLKNLICFSILS